MSTPGTVTLPLARARALAEKIVGELAINCERIEIAGSIRRGRPYCGDIDLVVLPKKMADISKILDRCAANATLLKRGDQYIVFTLANGFQLDLWVAHAGGIGENPDLFDTELKRVPGNFGVLLLARTGSAMHNVWIAQTAQARGLHFNPHKGVLRGKEVVASVEEADIFAALGLDFIAPERRER